MIRFRRVPYLVSFLLVVEQHCWLRSEEIGVGKNKMNFGRVGEVRRQLIFYGLKIRKIQSH